MPTIFLPILTESFLVRGGINEVFACYWDTTLQPNKIMRYVDMNSAHTAAAFEEFPIGDYKVSCSIVLFHI